MPYDHLIYTTHASRRMYERAIYPHDVRHVLRTGEVIETYPDDLPLPSYLMLGWIEPEPGRHMPVHVVGQTMTQPMKPTSSRSTYQTRIDGRRTIEREQTDKRSHGKAKSLRLL